jgi:hypothetical protein
LKPGIMELPGSRWSAALLLGLAMALVPRGAAADDEASEQTVRVETASGAAARLTVRYDQKQWRFDWRAGSTRHRGRLARIPQHAHLAVFVPAKGDRFVVVDTHAGHRHRDRILIYASDGTLVKSFGLADLFTRAELDRIPISVSHLWWLDSSKPCGATARHGDVVVLPTAVGATVEVSASKATATR